MEFHMFEQAGIFILGILAGWVIEWIFVLLFVPSPEKKLESALQASRKENAQLQKQNNELQTALNTAKAPAPAAKVVEAPVATEAAPAEDDDLTKLSGIGPKLAEAMNAAGINHYAQLAELSVETLGQRLASSGIRYSKASAESWATQAALAGKSDWDGLKTYQTALKG